MPAEDLATYVEQQTVGYIDERVAAGERREDAGRVAAEQIGRFFPGGAPAGGHLVFWVVAEGERVGTLWIGPQGRHNPTAFWVWSVEILEQHRGNGYGRQAMLRAEEVSRQEGASELGLNVFGHNTVARHLYESLGYATAAVTMRKELVPDR